MPCILSIMNFVVQAYPMLNFKKDKKKFLIGNVQVSAVLNVVLLGFDVYIFLEHCFLSSATSKCDEISITRRNEDP